MCAVVQTKDNVALVSNLLSNVSVKVKTNSSLTQKVAITSNRSGEEIFNATGTGEGNNIIGQSTISEVGYFTITFNVLKDGQWGNPKLQTGGPYQVGRYNLLVVVSESGDDSDYNDSILEFSWYSA